MLGSNGRALGTPESDGQAIGPLLKQLAEQTRRLSQQELKLAKAELAVKGKAAGVAAGLFSGAGLLGLFALIALSAALVLGLATVVAPWVAALITAGLYVVGAAVLALLGRTWMARATPLAPTRAIQSVKEDVAWLKNSAKNAKR